MPQTKFYGSQVGGAPITSHSYTDSPLTLLRHDISSAFSFFLFLPFIVFPFNPLKSGKLCELYPSFSNLWSMFLHVILILLQLPFLISIPFWVFLPVWVVLVGVSVFMVVNIGLWRLLNGNGGQIEYPSNPAYASKEGHEHEQWIFLNGVAVGKHWLQSNVDRLALTFGRPVLGIHNTTNGILFDVVQCLIQRNFNYATPDIRSCYRIVKDTLYNPNLTKVVFILHSQGGIEGGMIIDWLLQEVPQDLLAKLEVYTFGNAANHFNNPHLHLLSQHMALKQPSLMTTTKTITSVHYHDTPLVNGNGNSNGNGNGGPTLNTTPRSTKTSSTSGKTIRYIEHYAHTSDFVARWGVLHFTTNFTLSPHCPRFMGRVFERQGQGHQLNMHYLDSMFPLLPAPSPNGGKGGSGFLGADETSNEFMDSILALGTEGESEEKRDEREGWEISYLGAHGGWDGEDEVLLRDMSPVSPETMRRFGLGMSKVNGEGSGGKEKKAEFRVRDLSRLWLYVNGKSPRADDVDVGIARMATL